LTQKQLPKSYGRPETVVVGRGANGNSGGVNITKTKCELPLR
jgi:hypothetical protein